jgi:vacuolar iron transporter family protein
MRAKHLEIHFAERIGWLRAAVLGANDGIVSTASLIVGVASSGATGAAVLTAGVAALVAGAMSMAAGEYVSVSSQADTERSDLARERTELETNPAFEFEELTKIYEQRGLDRSLAEAVAKQLMTHDALGTHAHDELGLSSALSAKPLQAAWTSALAFSSGAALPLAVAALAPARTVVSITAGGSLICLALLGALAAKTGGSSATRSIARIVFWGALAMFATAIVGRLFGTFV